MGNGQAIKRWRKLGETQLIYVKRLAHERELWQEAKAKVWPYVLVIGRNEVFV
jgi:hypothetical protein